MRWLSSIAFATSNRHKIKEVERILKDFGIMVRPFNGKGIEIQADDVSEVAAASSRQACISLGGPLIVEDAGLFVNALKGFPGPYSSFVFRKIGTEGVLSLLEGMERRSAKFRSAVAYCEAGKEPMVFEGVVRGRISSKASGVNGFGFDPIFVPEGHRRTLAQMTIDEKCQVSHRAVSVRRFATWFTRRT